MPDMRGGTESRREGTPLSLSLPLSLSDGPSHSLPCMRVLSLEGSLYLLLLLVLRSLSLSRAFTALPSSSLCLSVVTLFRGREKGGGGERWVSSPLFFLPQLHHSFPTVLVSPSFTLYIPLTHRSTTTHHPSWGFLAKWGKQIE